MYLQCTRLHLHDHIAPLHPEEYVAVERLAGPVGPGQVGLLLAEEMRYRYRYRTSVRGDKVQVQVQDQGRSGTGPPTVRGTKYRYRIGQPSSDKRSRSRYR